MSHPRLYLSQDIRAAERQWAKDNHASTYALMDAAAQSLLQVCLDSWPGIRHVTVLCGGGNNGGDGVALAVKLSQLGISVSLYLVAAFKPGSDAEQAFQLVQGSDVDVFHIVDGDPLELQSTQLIVDALLGSGTIGPPRSIYAQCIQYLNAAQVPILSVDVPSGLNMDTGAISGIESVVEATITLTFGSLKPGLVTGIAKQMVGRLVLAPIGLEHQLSTLNAIGTQVTGSILTLSKRSAAAHKGTMGSVALFGGDVTMPGALVLASNACARMGVGYVFCCTHSSNRTVLVNANPSLLVSDIDAIDMPLFLSQKTALVLGPGLGRTPMAYDAVSRVLAAAIDASLPVVVDADGLNILSEQPTQYANWILTPHAKEAARLLGWQDVAAVEKDRLAAARAIQEKYGGICVLKGPGTVVYDGEQTYINASGSAGMARAGMGDVLAGMIGGLLARFPQLPIVDLVVTAVWMHGHAGQLAAAAGHEESMQADDVIAAIPQCWHEVLPQR